MKASTDRNKKKAKKVRPDGRVQVSDTINGKRVYALGRTQEEAELKLELKIQGVKKKIENDKINLLKQFFGELIGFSRDEIKDFLFSVFCDECGLTERKYKKKMGVQFFMAMNPPTVTAQEKKVMIRNSKPVFFEPMELKAARQKLTDSLAAHSPAFPARGALELVTKWCFRPGRLPVLPDEDLKDWHEWKVTRPDTDNLQKLLKDCMSQVGFWKDDAQVCREIVEKHWAAIPGIYIRITELER